MRRPAEDGTGREWISGQDLDALMKKIGVYRRRFSAEKAARQRENFVQKLRKPPSTERTIFEGRNKQ